MEGTSCFLTSLPRSEFLIGFEMLVNKALSKNIFMFLHTKKVTRWLSLIELNALGKTNLTFKSYKTCSLLFSFLEGLRDKISTQQFRQNDGI